jgi:parvulin-like peptidyl-prolyl isomerase
VRFTAEEFQILREQLFRGLSCPSPTNFQADWISELPEQFRPQIKARWDTVRLRKWLEEHYGQHVESHYLQRQSDLEQVVFRMIRLRQQGLAEEIYLRLIDQEESFGELASRFSLGEERYTYGLVGPLPITQPHPKVRSVLANLKTGDISPPFVADNTILLLKLEHRIPARLDEAMRQRLLQELFQPDLEAAVEAMVAQALPGQDNSTVSSSLESAEAVTAGSPEPSGRPQP